MKKLVLLIVTVILVKAVQAQIPQTLNYQGIARNASGEPIRYQEISVRISIIDSALAGKLAYQETRRVMTNYVGLFNIVIGGPDAFYVLGNISAVDWATGNKHIKLEIDPAGQSNYTIAGITKLQSVPYALYSTPSGNASGDLTGNYPSPSIASKAVNTSKLADGSVTDIKVAMGINPAKVGLDKVNNTADIDKPVSTATQVALSSKLNIADTNTMLSNRFNRDTVSLSNRINLKANTTDVNTSLALKANTADVNTSLALKANITDVNTSLALKANTTDVNTSLALKENISNKSLDVSADGTSDEKYPTVKSVKTYVDLMAGNILAGQVNADWTATVGPAKILNKPNLFSGVYSDLTGKPTLFTGSYTDLTNKPNLFSGAYSDLTGKPTLFSGSYTDLTNKPNLFSGSYSDLTNKPVIPAAQVSADWNATTGVAMILNKPTLFSGAYADLTGPIPTWNQNTTGNAATATKLAASKNINGVAFDGSADITITAAAATLSGTVQVANGGTGASTITGLIKGNGTNAMSAAISGTDYLAPTGSAAALTNFPTLNQNTTGNAATATKLAAPKNINGVAFDGSADITITAEANTLTGTVQVVNGGTGTSTITGLVKGNGTNAMSAAISGTDYLAPTGSAAALTNFPTLNQNTTGNAATATKLATPKNINGVAFDGSADITITAAASTLYGTVQVANGGTGLTNAGLTGQVLTTVAGGTLSWTTPTSISVGAISNTSNVNGASITGGVLNLAPADGTNGGILNASNQTIGGPKYFLDNITISNGIKLGTTGGAQNLMYGGAVFAYGTPGANNTGIGSYALSSLTNTGNEGNNNTAVGTNAIRQGGAANGSRNTAVGSSALSNGSGTSDNVAIGYYTLAAGISGGSNTAVGTYALQNNSTASYNVGIGYETLKNTTTGGSNTAVGRGAMLSNTSGDVNTAVGESALISNTNGRYNTSIGVQSQELNTTGQSNTAIGVAAIDRNTGGNNNAVLGAFAGRYIADGTTYNTAIDNSILIGASAKPLANNANNEIVIGYNAVGNGSNTVTLGNTSITSVKTSGAFNAPIYSSTPQALTAGSNISWNPLSGLNASVTLNANSTLAFSALPPVGSSGTLIISQPASGSTYTLTLPSATTNRVLGSSSGVTLSNTNSAKDILSFYYDGNAFYWNIGNGYGSSQTVNATNIVGGTAGAVLYQSGSGTTGFTAAGTSGQVLTSAGTGAPTWTTPSTGVGGSGTLNYLSKFSATSTLANSSIIDEGTGVYFKTADANSTSGAGGATVKIGTNGRSMPATSGTAQNSVGLRLASNNNDVLDFGIGSRIAWLQSSDLLNLGAGYDINLNPVGGNVGIGMNTAPTSKLDVNGNVKASSFNSTIVNSVGSNVILGQGNVLASLTTGSNNVGVGQYTLNYLAAGSENLGMGYSAMYNTRGSNNVGLGHNSLWTNNTGNNNTAIGHTSGYNNSGSDNTFLGYNANSSGGISNATAIGSGATVSASNTIQLGNTSTTSVNTSGGLTANAAVTNEITSSFTIDANNAETYKGKIIICNPSAAITITFAASLPTGFNCMVLQKSADANKVTFAAGTSVTIKNRNNYTATAGNYALATIVHIGGNIIVTAGDMQ
ncbi:MAG: beta strand repeat-containing protein [Bacteroidota bacterium]